MNEFLDYKDDILKCTRCGLCQSVCPVYKVEKNECAVSKGKFNILYGVLRKDLQLNRNVIKNIDLCLNCNACKDFCPSGIDAVEIFSTVRYEYRKQCQFFNFSKLFFSAKTLNFWLFSAGLAAKVYRFFGFDRINASVFAPLNSFLRINSKRKNTNQLPHKRFKVGYFEGCVNKYINPSVENASLNLLERAGCEVDVLNFNCCGVMFKTSGDFESFEELKRHNLKIIQDSSLDYILFDCETCLDTIKGYFEENDCTKELMSVAAFLEQQGLLPELTHSTKITYHKPCHQKIIPGFLKTAKNIEYVQAVDYDTCCGFAGLFAIKQNRISQSISKSKAVKLNESTPDYLITACPSCILGLAQGQYLSGHKTPILTVTELLDRLST